MKWRNSNKTEIAIINNSANINIENMEKNINI